MRAKAYCAHLSNRDNWALSRCKLQNFECTPTSVHALCHTGSECPFGVCSSMLVELAVSTLGWSVLAADDTGVVVQ
ncbi:hypothetical protein TNCV_1286081 [Trichonephila clavipes]|uniref:Uncharacterized protein n=1 Tax=Trichonephila clavipes TaxID=2585209 RepID=A0A8X6T044_TRICX|nr:hypothetical protein TNCV_1286081 [Trichonephila clavipes]